MLTNAIIMEDVYALSDVQIQTKIGEKIKATRLKQNITQESLAATWQSFNLMTICNHPK